MGDCQRKSWLWCGVYDCSITAVYNDVHLSKIFGKQAVATHKKAINTVLY